MAQLAIAAAGAVAGFAVGGPGGAKIGWAVGSLVGSQFGPKENVQGPRLSDLKVTSGSYGDVIPWAAGHPRVAGQVWWSSQRREESQTSEQGKGGGATQTTYTYTVDILYGLVDREILYVARIWSNGKLIWTASSESDEDSLSTSQNNPPWDRITIYTGSSTQLPDPTYEAAVTNAPAYRGRGTVFIEGLQLGNSGVIPNLTFEVVIDGQLTYLDKGFLSQFEVLTSPTTIEATLGPDINLTGSEAISTSVKKFGTGSVAIASGTVDTPTTMTLDITGKSWRVEGWSYVSTDTGRLVRIDSSVNSYRIDLEVDTRPASFGPVTVNYLSSLGSGGGTPTGAPTPTPSNRPPKNQWLHWSIQYTKATGYVLFHVNGYYWGRMMTVAGVPFTGDAFNRITFGGGSGDGYADSTLYRYFDDDEEALLYPAADIAVPTEPFEPPPYAYTSVEVDDDTLQNVVEALCARAGMPTGTYGATALSAITKPVRAIAVGQVTSARAVLEILMSAYFFEAFATDKLYFVPRAGSVVDALDLDDLATGIEQAETESLPMQVGSNAEISAQVAVSYMNVFSDYNTAAEQSDRLLTGQVNTASVQLPMAFTAEEAKGIADAMVIDGYASRVTGSLSLPIEYAELQPTNVVTVPDDEGSTYRVRMVRRVDEGNVLKFDWVLDDATAVESAGITSEDYTPVISVALPGVTEMALLDVPLLRDDDNYLGHYVAATSHSTTWPGASIQRSLDDVEYTEAAVISERGTLGVTTTTLGNWTGGNVFDEVNTVTVDVGSTGTLSSSTRDAMLADTEVNAMQIGDEVIRFRTATGGAGVYVLSGLLRGQKGTEWAMSGHAIGEQVVLLRLQGLRYVTIDLPSVGATRYYKGVTRGRALSTADSESFTCDAVSLLPLYPVDIRRTVNAANEIILTWNRRTRLSSAFLATTGVPLGEATESYSVDVVLISGGVLKRTITSSAPTITYTAAQQTADGVTGSTAIRFDVYQMSTVVGRGRAGSLSTVGAVTPRAQITALTVGGTYASGANLYATLGGVTYSYTSTVPDATLSGIAASFAAIIDAATAYSAAAVGPVVNVTGPVSTAFSVVAGVTAGDNTLTWNLTQTASATVAGVGNGILFGWKNLSDPGGENAYPFGMHFNLLVQRTSPALNLIYTVTNSEAGGFTDYRILPGLIGAFISKFNASGAAATYGLSMTPNDYPNGTVKLTTPASEPFNWTVQANSNIPSVSGLGANLASGIEPATLRPQIVTLTLSGTPTTGWVYRATLAGVNFDYTATGGDTTMALVATGLASVIDADGDYIASAVGAVITITHASNNVAFTYSGTIIASTVTVTAANTQEAA